MSQKTEFECPPDYEAVDIKEASILLEDEDVQEDKEMWLLRVPTQFDVKCLSGKNIDISDWSSNQFTSSKDIAYTCIASNPSELNEMTVIMPNKKTKAMMAAPKPLAGLCYFLRDFDLPSPKIPASNRVKPEMPTGLKARFEPFGTGPSNSSVKYHGRIEKSQTANDDSRQNKPHKSKKHKRQESESSLKVDKPHKKHKSSKKKSKEKEA